MSPYMPLAMCSATIGVAQCVFGVHDVSGSALRRLLGRRRAWCGGGGWRSRGRLRTLRCGEEGNHVGAVLIGLQSGKRHLVAGHGLLGIGEIGIERLWVPDETGPLRGRRIA